MRLDMDTIQFDERSEVRAILEMINTYLNEHPKERNNEVITHLYNCLDVMDLTW